MNNSYMPACLATLILIAVFSGCQKPVEVPQNFKKWNSSDGAFAIELPSAWLPQGGVNKNHGSSYVKAEKGGVSIRVDASFTQSILGDIMGGSGNTSELPDDLRPEAMLHEQNLDYYKENYRDYEEDAAETKRLPIGMTRIAEFTATQGLGKIRGIRATVCTVDKGVTFRAFAPEGQWGDFKPVFYKLLEEMKRGVKQ
jgi:hypothetical protein